MSSVRSKIPRLAKKPKNITHMERIRLIETEMAQILELKYKDISTVIMNKFKVLIENLDLMAEEMRESLKNDLKEIGVRSSISEMKNPKNSSTRKEWQQIKDTASIKTGLVEKIEGENYKIAEDVENLTVKRKKIIELNSKLYKAEECNTNQSKKLSQNESQNHKVMGSVEEAISDVGDRGRNFNIHLEVTGEGQEKGEEEMRDKKTTQNFKNKEKILKVSREDEGAILTLAADFSSATLDVSKQWSNVFNILKENDFEPKFLCQINLMFKCDGEIKTFSDMQSLSKFTSQKSFMRELLKGVLPQNKKIKKRGRRYGIQEKVDKSLIDSKQGAGEATSDGLNFLFIKEVKVAKPEELKNLEIQEEESSEWKEKEALQEEEASELEEEREEASELEEGEYTSGLEEEEEASELEEGEYTSGLEEEEEENLEFEKKGLEATVLYKKQHSTFQPHTMVKTKHGFEIPNEGLENIIIKEVEDSDQEEEEGSEWELEVFLTWEEEKDFEVEKVKTASQIAKKEASHGLQEFAVSYLPSDSEKKKFMEHQVVQKTQNKGETAIPRNQEIGTLCPALHGTSPSKALEISSDKQKKHSCANLSTPPGITKVLRKTEGERHKTLQTKELTFEETDVIQETEENFRRSVINFFGEIQEEIENIKNCHTEVLEVKNSIPALSNRIDILKERMSNLEDRIEEFPKDTMQMAKQIIIKERIRDIEDRSRSSNIRLIGIPEKDNKENGAEEIIREIIEENFPELKKDSNLVIVSACRVPSKIDEKRLTPRHILVKFGNYNDKEKIINASREKKEITYRGIRIRLTADLSLDTLDARSQWGNIIKVLKAKDFKPRILYPAKLAFDFEGKTKIFFDTEEFRKFISCTPFLKELLEDIF
uniref:LINE-1 type transposase domain-containing protein 1 n=1 Tax=Dobsonia moluccensis TaxID=42147 RepID=A0A088QCG2_DOBMO|nr:L1TD1 [Dobsonia moluccensis]